MNERDQVINFLFNQCDAKTRVILELEARLKAAEAQIPKAPKQKQNA